MHSIMVTVTDSCGKSASAMWSVSVTEGTGGGGNLTGLWTGTIYNNEGLSIRFSLQLSQMGTNVTGTAYGGGRSSPGSGSYAAGQFQWWGTTTIITLVGTYNPYAEELAGDWMVGGLRGGTWRVCR